MVLAVAGLVLGLTGCDLGRVPEADRPSSGPTTPRYLGEADLKRVYRYADEMTASSKAVTDKRIMACERISDATRLRARTECWEILLTPLGTAFRSFGTSVAGMHYPDLSENCDRALTRITVQSKKAGQTVDDLVAWFGSPDPEDREYAADYIYDLLGEAEDDVDNTYTRFERHCIDPADLGQDDV